MNVVTKLCYLTVTRFSPEYRIVFGLFAHLPSVTSRLERQEKTTLTWLDRLKLIEFKQDEKRLAKKLTLNADCEKIRKFNK